MTTHINLSRTPRFITNEEAQEIMQYASERGVILRSGIDSLTVGDKALGLVVEALSDHPLFPHFKP